MWLFDPSSPCIAILTHTPSSSDISRAWQPAPSTMQLTNSGPVRHPPYQAYGRTDRQAGTWEKNMLWTITVILFVLWLLGLVSGYTLAGWIHILLVLALIVLIFNLLSGRRAV
jgi:hypothetical protein